jgi:hypothetical protein
MKGRLGGAAEQHDQRRAIVAEQPRIGVEDDDLPPVRAEREDQQDSSHETQHESSI